MAAKVTLEKILNKYRAVFQAYGDDSSRNTFRGELNYEAGKIFIALFASMFIWLPYIPIDMKLHQYPMFAVSVRIGLSLLCFCTIVLKCTKCFRYRPNILVAIIVWYYYIGTSLITATAGTYTSSYIGGFCIIVLISIYAPFSFKFKIIVSLFSFALFLTIGALTGLDYSDAAVKYSTNDLFSAFFISILISYIINSVKYKSWENRQELSKITKSTLRRKELTDTLLNALNRAAAILLSVNDEDVFYTLLLESMEVMGHCLGVDCVHIWRSELRDGIPHYVHHYVWLNDMVQECNVIPIGLNFPYSDMPALEEKFLKDECINMPISELPQHEFNFFNQYGIKTLIAIPLFLHNQFWGFISLDNCHEERLFTNDEINIMRSAGLMMISVMNRVAQTVKMHEIEGRDREKSVFLAKMSHEIRTPMNAIIGIAQIQLQKGGLPDDSIDALERIYISGTNLLGIINDILDMSKIETGKLEICPIEYDVPSLINDAVQLNFVRIGSKTITFTLDVDETLPLKLIGDEMRIKQILNNLLSNAIKYTETGFIKFSISHYREGEETFLRFSIADSGQGIKPEDLKNMFTEYSRFNAEANRTTEGTGLGLNITKKLIEMMDGTINVASEYGKGSTFTVAIKQKTITCMPFGPELSERLRNFKFTDKKQMSKLQITRVPMPYGKVLIVDDIETNLYVAKGLLLPYKLNTDTALSGFEVINKVKSGTIYDIIFMDHMMPEMDGIETTRRLRALEYTGAIVALTANAIVGNDELFAKNGFDGFIAKPIDIRQLNEVLNKFVRDRHPEEAEKWKPETVAQAGSGQKAEINPVLLEVFRRDAQKAVITLRQTKACGNLKLFTTTVHAMKSALANIGENKASQSAALLENAGQKGDMDYISTFAENFINTLESLIEKLRPEQAAPSDSAGLCEDTAYLAEQLKTIKTACDNYDDATAYAALEGLKTKTWEPETAEMLRHIYDSLFFDSNFEKAAEIAQNCQIIP